MEMNPFREYFTFSVGEYTLYEMKSKVNNNYLVSVEFWNQLYSTLMKSAVQS